MLFYKVTQKPGKPLLFSRRENQLIFGLPGNPLGAQLCFHRYVAPAARQMMDRTAVIQPAPGRLSKPLVVSSVRELFVLARATGEEGRREVTPLLGRGSADIFSCPAANAYIRLEPGQHRLNTGETIQFEWMGI